MNDDDVRYFGILRRSPRQLQFLRSLFQEDPRVVSGKGLWPGAKKSFLEAIGPKCNLQVTSLLRYVEG